MSSVLSKQGTTRRGRYFILKVFPGTAAFSRIGVVISAAVLPKASGRNRLRRMVYDASSPLLSKTPTDYLLIAQRGQYDEAADDAIIKELKNLLN